MYGRRCGYFLAYGFLNFVLHRGVCPGDKRTSSENELVGHTEISDDRERHPN